MSGVVLCLMSDGNVKLRCTESIAWAIAERVVDAAFFYEAGHYLDDGRNACVRRFLKRFPDLDRLLMVDSDIEFTPADVELLAVDNLPIVSGVYHSAFDGELRPVAYAWDEEQEQLVPARAWPDGPLQESFHEHPLVEMGASGAGFLMVKREVFQALGEIHGEPCPYFAEEIRGGRHYGEDMCFCLRAAEAGYKTVLDRRVQVAHHKGVRLGGGPMLVSLETNVNEQEP